MSHERRRRRTDLESDKMGISNAHIHAARAMEAPGGGAPSPGRTPRPGAWGSPEHRAAWEARNYPDGIRSEAGRQRASEAYLQAAPRFDATGPAWGTPEHRRAWEAENYPEGIHTAGERRRAAKAYEADAVHARKAERTQRSRAAKITDIYNTHGAEHAEEALNAMTHGQSRNSPDVQGILRRLPEKLQKELGVFDDLIGRHI